MNENINKIFLLTMLTFLQSLSGMDQPLQGDDLVLHLISTQYLSNHLAICSFAATSKANNARMVAAAKGKSKLLQSTDKITFEEEVGILRHKLGSACYLANGNFNHICLSLNYYELEDKENLGPTKRIAFNEGFLSPLQYKPTPFFGDNGVLYFYGYGRKSLPLEITDHPDISCVSMLSVIRYGLDRSYIRCIVNTPENNYLMHFLEYPVLLRAVLNSKIINTKMKFSQRNFLPSEEYLEFSLQGVTIPDNYAERNPFKEGRYYVHESFDSFPDDVKQAIEKRYAEQQNEIRK